jgi:hypothetical protein
MKGLIREFRNPGLVTRGGFGILMDEMCNGWSMEVSTCIRRGSISNNLNPALFSSNLRPHATSVASLHTPLAVCAGTLLPAIVVPLHPASLFNRIAGKLALSTFSYSCSSPLRNTGSLASLKISLARGAASRGSSVRGCIGEYDREERLSPTFG